jgi:hypothetical protein
MSGSDINIVRCFPAAYAGAIDTSAKPIVATSLSLFEDFIFFLPIPSWGQFSNFA